jgi:hypothetical protein
MQFRRFILLSAGLVAIDAGSVRSCPDPAAKTAAVTKDRPASTTVVVPWKPRPWAPPIANGLRVSIDPVDGAYSMPNADETPQVMSSRNEAPVAVTRRADGSVRAQLDERFADFAVVTLGGDGTPRWYCLHGSVLADQFMRMPSPALAPAPGTVWVEK